MTEATLPVMPVHAAAVTAYVIYTVLMCAITVAMLLWWAGTRERTRGPAFPLLIVGGCLSGLLEPFLDNIVLFWYPPQQPLAAFQAFDRTIPWFVVIGYGWFCGGQLYLAARLYQRGLTHRQVWALAAVIALIDFLAIGLTSWLNVAGFYGDPPLAVAGYPLWWAPVDVVIVVAGGALVHYLLPRLQGAALLQLLAVPTLLVGGAGGAVLGPVAIARNSQWSSSAELAAAAVTIALGAAIIQLIAQAVSVPRGDDATTRLGWRNSTNNASLTKARAQ